MNREILKRYFDNACTPAEREKVAEWLSDPRQREDILQYMEAEWEQCRFSGEELERASTELALPFETLFRQVQTAGIPRIGISPKKDSRSLSWGLTRVGRVAVGIAASLLFLAAGIWIGYRYQGRGMMEKGEVYYAQTFKGQRSRLTLSDGSEIFLNADSRVTIPNETNARQVVYLEGEAYFKIPNKEKPLIIKTKDFVASSRGSQFNISAFPKDSTMTVSVEKGRAEISSNTEQSFPMLNLRFPDKDSAAKKESVIKDSAAAKPKVLPMLALKILVVKANECVTFDNRNKGAVAPAHLSEEEASAWKDGVIYFHQVDSAALVDKLERWFNVEVSLNAGGIPLKPHNCGFKNATLEDVLRHITLEQGLEYHIDGKHVYMNRPAAKEGPDKK